MSDDEYYPWSGEFTACLPNSCVAVVLLQSNYAPPKNVAIFGFLKTENIGIEKIVANVVSNPHIRYLVVCGEDIRGHRSGSSLLALYKHGLDTNNRIINAPGAIPYIENLDNDAIKRFQSQIIEIIDLMNVTDKTKIDAIIKNLIAKPSSSYGKPYIVIKIKPKVSIRTEDKRALHAKIVVDYLGKIQKRG